MKQPNDHNHSQLIKILEKDPFRINVLELVDEVTKGEGWVGGGFVRHLVWDNIKGGDGALLNDIDVIYLGKGEAKLQRTWQEQLCTLEKSVKWSVKDQNLMADRSMKAHYSSISHALSDWVEICTAVAVRRMGRTIEVAAPYGITELFEGIVSPTSEKMRDIMNKRVTEKSWLIQYPFLRVR